MKRKSLIYQIILFNFVFSISSLVYFNDMTKLTKKGGMSYEELWKEKDVKNYLKLPYMVSIDNFEKKISIKGKIGRYQVNNVKKCKFENNNKMNSISFQLDGNNLFTFRITIYDYKSWNMICDNLYRHIIDTVSLWNKIPEYYKIFKDDNIYTITYIGESPKKWYFDLRRMIVITIDSQYSGNNISKDEKKIRKQIDEIINYLMILLVSGNGKSK